MYYIILCTLKSVSLLNLVHIFRCEASMRYSTFIQDTAFTQGKTAVHLMVYFQALKSVFLLNLVQIFSLPNFISLIVLKSPARLLNDTSAVYMYLWSSSTVSVVLTVSTSASVS